MPPWVRSSLAWAQLTQTNTLVHLHHSQSWCDSHTSLEWGTGYCHATRSGCPGGHPCPRVELLTGPGPYEQSCTSLWVSTPSHPSPVGCSLYQYTPSRMFTFQVPHQSPAHSGITPPNGASDDQPRKRAHTKTIEAKASSGHSTLQGGKELSKMPPGMHHNGTDAMTTPKSTAAGTALIMAVMSQPRMNWGRMQPTLIWNWPQGIVSSVQVWSQVSE